MQAETSSSVCRQRRESIDLGGSTLCTEGVSSACVTPKRDSGGGAAGDGSVPSAGHAREQIDASVARWQAVASLLKAGDWKGIRDTLGLPELLPVADVSNAAAHQLVTFVLQEYETVVALRPARNLLMSPALEPSPANRYLAGRVEEMAAALERKSDENRALKEEIAELRAVLHEQRSLLSDSVSVANERVISEFEARMHDSAAVISDLQRQRDDLSASLEKQCARHTRALSRASQIATDMVAAADAHKRETASALAEAAQHRTALTNLRHRHREQLKRGRDLYDSILLKRVDPSPRRRGSAGSGGSLASLPAGVWKTADVQALVAYCETVLRNTPPQRAAGPPFDRQAEDTSTDAPPPRLAHGGPFSAAKKSEAAPADPSSAAGPDDSTGCPAHNSSGQGSASSYCTAASDSFTAALPSNPAPAGCERAATPGKGAAEPVSSSELTQACHTVLSSLHSILQSPRHSGSVVKAFRTSSLEEAFDCVTLVVGTLASFFPTVQAFLSDLSSELLLFRQALASTFNNLPLSDGLPVEVEPGFQAAAFSAVELLRSWRIVSRDYIISSTLHSILQSPRHSGSAVKAFRTSSLEVAFDCVTLVVLHGGQRLDHRRLAFESGPDEAQPRSRILQSPRHSGSVVKAFRTSSLEEAFDCVTLVVGTLASFFPTVQAFLSDLSSELLLFRQALASTFNNLPLSDGLPVEVEPGFQAAAFSAVELLRSWRVSIRNAHVIVIDRES
ncbi:hypothetical protein DIPPA_17931 [Diplonema papillatum]|nr:hypothetical protein DIPPA_17931 [Diplonema papillatum]